MGGQSELNCLFAWDTRVWLSCIETRRKPSVVDCMVDFIY